MSPADYLIDRLQRTQLIQPNVELAQLQRVLQLIRHLHAQLEGRAASNPYPQATEAVAVIYLAVGKDHLLAKLEVLVRLLQTLPYSPKDVMVITATLLKLTGQEQLEVSGSPMLTILRRVLP